VTAELISAVTSLATQVGADWTFLLDVDRDPPGTPRRDKLDAFVTRALDARLPEILARPEPLLLTDALVLGRYGQQRWLADLANLATVKPAARWLLVPRHDAAGAPMLDGHVPVPLGADGYLVLNSEFLAATAQRTNPTPTNKPFAQEPAP
jgi:hypothetical protein